MTDSTTDKQVLADSHNEEAINAAAVAKEAEQKAHAATIEAIVADGNQKLIDEFRDIRNTVKPEWFEQHEEDDNLRFDEQKELIKKLMTKSDFEQMLRPSLIKILLNTGRGTKATLLTIAVIIGALAVIGGGLKVILGWIGFSFIPRV